MNRCKKETLASGYPTFNFSYRSMVEPLDKVGKRLYDEVKSCNADTVSFITHSMGALVVRTMYRFIDGEEDFPVIFRIVMVAPPNHGAESADRYAHKKFFRCLLGPNLALMTTDSLSFANKLPVPEGAEIGIIAGIKGDGKGFNRKLSGDNDGLLTPQNAKLNIAKEMIVVEGQHTALILSPEIAKLAVSFLENGYYFP